MEFNDAIREIKKIVPITRYLTKSKGKNKYNCIFCYSGQGQGGHNTGAMEYYPDQNAAYCFSCHNAEIGGKRADSINAQMKVYNQDFKEAIFQLADENNIVIDGRQSNKATESHQAASKKKNEEKAVLVEKTAQNAYQAEYKPKEPTPYQFKEYIEQCQEKAEKAVEYLQNRGISPVLIKRFRIGYDPNKPIRDKETGKKYVGAVIFPHTANYSYYSCRSIEGKGFDKPKAEIAGEQPLFNPAALYAEKPCFVCEGIADALSIMTAGGEAVALVGTAGKPLIRAIKNKRPRHALILCLDNDTPKESGATPGQDNQKKIATTLDDMKIPYIEAQFSYDQYNGGNDKDANDLLMADAGQLSKDVETNEKRAIEATPSARPDNTLDYINKIMAGEIEKLKADAGRKTGFPNLDHEAGSVYSGLYIIGGISSVGKTTFAHQMADQMAARGQHVLFFSLEQSRLEMVSKSIARETAIIDSSRATSSLQIRLGATGGNIRSAYSEYMKNVEDRISIIEGNFSCNVVFIEEYAKNYIEQNGVRPCVFVDYLQILPAIPDENNRKSTDQRQITDMNITALKRMSRNLEIPVIVVSSLNRSNYLTPIDFESFKESGGIEYSADVILGLQLKVIHDDFFNKEGKTKEKRERMAAAKIANPREIELVCLKNRYGKSRYDCYFKYYPANDYYLPCDENGQPYKDFSSDDYKR